MDIDTKTKVDPLTLEFSSPESDPKSVTEIDLTDLNITSLKSIKNNLYEMCESANRLGMSIQVENLHLISSDVSNCTHFMESCNRSISNFSDLYMVLQSVVSSTSGNRRKHLIKLNSK